VLRKRIKKQKTRVGVIMWKKTLIAGAGIIIVAMIVFFLLTDLKIVNGWPASEQPAVVLKNKVWELTFSQGLNQQSVNSENVYVTNHANQRVEVSLQYEEGAKTLAIHPPEGGYAAGEYSLHLNKGLRASIGRELLSEQSLRFSVQEKLPIIGSRENLQGYFSRILQSQQRPGENIAYREESAMDSAGAGSPESANSAASSTNYSETNVQVQGIDESDIVKTDGEAIYKLAENRVQIIKAKPANQMEVLTSISFQKDFSPFQLLLDGNHLIVLGNSFPELAQEASRQEKPGVPAFQNLTRVLVFDISDRNNPTEIRAIDIEGQFFTAREKDGIVYIVANYYPDYWLMEQNNPVDLRPKFKDSATGGDFQPVDYDQIQYVPDSMETNYSIIAAFDINKPDQQASITTFLGNGNVLYMSNSNLYLAVNSYANQILPEIGAASDSSSTAIDIALPAPAVSTSIYKYSVNGTDIQFSASTEVDGTILNQFSMDEYQENFRIVTTNGNTWDEQQPSSNNLYIYNKEMQKIGEVTDLARGERIYSARFLGDKIYMVTFKQVDPLFVIDASQPEKPVLLGELKIPGFSNYLHPLDEHHLIGIGKNTKTVTNNGAAEPGIMTDGVKISLFDVTDFSNPVEMDYVIIGEGSTYTPLEFDHKALFVHEDKHLFGFPITVYKKVPGSEYGETFEFQGAQIYEIDPQTGISLKTEVTHVEGKAQYEEWENSIQRLLYIDDTIYSIANDSVAAYQLTDFTKIGQLSIR
ncbi:beta-propeller domain-containing protein, partial [Bacillaceae bacterium Marseille-Q3522]|nr:beta-propeller domain-containing protein [Bacillaceae bacterium Marseille-Q3522]